MAQASGAAHTSRPTEVLSGNGGCLMAVLLSPSASLQLTGISQKAYTLVRDLISVAAAQGTLPESLAVVASRASTWGLTGLYYLHTLKALPEGLASIEPESRY